MLPPILRRLLMVGVIPMISGGCSYFLVSGPPIGHERMNYFTCTENKIVPALDGVWAGLNALGAYSALTGTDSDYSTTDGTYSKSSVALVGLSWLAVSGYAAYTGSRKVDECQAAKLAAANRAAGGTTSDPFGLSTPDHALLHESVAVAPLSAHCCQRGLMAPVPLRSDHCDRDGHVRIPASEPLRGDATAGFQSVRLPDPVSPRLRLLCRAGDPAAEDPAVHPGA